MTPSRHPDKVDIEYGFALVRVCRSCIRLQARASQRFLVTSSSIFRVIASVPAGSRTSPRLHSLCNNDIGIIRVVTGVPASTTGPRQLRVSNPSAATTPELVVAQGLHDTLIQRLTEDLLRAAFLVSVGVSLKKA